MDVSDAVITTSELAQAVQSDGLAAPQEAMQTDSARPSFKPLTAAEMSVCPQAPKVLL